MSINSQRLNMKIDRTFMTSKWAGKNVLVTGAAGFIGSHLTESLVRQGASVRAFVRYTSRADIGLLRLLPLNLQERIEIIAGDIRDASAIRRAVEGVDCVFHLGAIVSIPYSYVHPVETVESNVIGTLNILTACREFKVSRLVHTSTSEVYGTAMETPMSEKHPLQAQSPYSASKIGADALVTSFFRSYAVPAITVRPFNTYGPRQSARAVIPTIITQALTQDVIRLGNLDARRDFTFVQDTVDGFAYAAVSSDKSLGNVYNLGVGDDISIGELAREIVRQVNRPVTIAIDDRRLRPEKSEVMHLHSDNRLALQDLGWSPKHSLQEGLAHTIHWVQEHLDYFRIGRYEI